MLDNVQLSGSALISEGSAGVAVSEIITQDAADTDFESVRDTRVRWLLGNICDTNQSTADKAAIIGDVQEGDRIFVVDSSNNPIETIATSVTTDLLAGLIPPMTSNTAPSGVVSADTSDSSAPAWQAFDGNSSTRSASSSYIQYEFDIPTEVKYFYLYGYFPSYASFNSSFNLYGSNDGSNYVKLWSKTFDVGNSSSSKSSTNKISSPGKFKYYKLTGTSWSYYGYYIYSLQFYTEPGKTIDTSAVTNGDTPKYVYRFEDKIKFNSTLCTEKSIYKEFGTHGSQLYIQNIYNDALISGRTLQTTVNFSAPGNEVLEITGQVYKQP